MSTFPESKYILLTVSLIFVTISTTNELVAQIKHKISYKLEKTATKYTRQHEIEIGDIPDHKIRIAELHRKYPENTLTFEGISVKEEWARFYTNYINENGYSEGYTEFILVNGDKVFTTDKALTQTTVKDDGTKITTAHVVSTITGGTGKFKNIQGYLNLVVNADPEKGINEPTVTGEYWIE